MNDRIIASQSPNADPTKNVRVIGTHTTAITKTANPTVTIFRNISFSSFSISITGFIAPFLDISFG